MAPYQGMNPRFLLIDDDILTQTILKDLLAEKGYSLNIASKGETGLSRAKKEAFDVIFVDIRLPDISGIEILRKAPLLPSKPLMVVITAYPDIETAIQSIKSGAYDYIKKPIDLKEFDVLLDRILDYRKLQLERDQLITTLSDYNKKLKEEKHRYLTALEESAKLVGAIKNIEEFFNVILEVVQKIGKVKNCSIMLLDKKINSLYIKAAKGLSKEIIEVTKVKIGESISGKVAKTKTPLLIKDIEKYPEFTEKKNRERYITKSLISVPILNKGNLIGVLNVNNKESGEAFKEDDLQVFTALSAQIATAIENYNLYTQLQEANKQLSKLHTELFEYTKLATLGELAAITAHELNTPLTTISGYIKMLPARIEDPAFRQKFCEIMKHEIERIIQINNKLLELPGKGKPVLIKSDLGEIVKKILLFIEPTLKESKVSLHFSLTPVPPLKLDPNQIEEVIINLATNAIQAMPDGGTLSISIRAVTREDIAEEGHKERFLRIMNVYELPQWAQIKVSDTGCGIPEENLDKLFKPFYTTKEKGTGLGLAICKRIISAHNGLMDVISSVRKGTIFYIYLPVEEPT